jgi:protein phosphatase 1G
MGQELSSLKDAPITSKIDKKGENERLKFCCSQMQGWRDTQEDTHIAELDIGHGVSIFGVFDGHGGPEVAKFV